MVSGKDLAREAVILVGTAGISGAIFWMAVFLAGPIVILAGAAVLFVGMAWFTRGVDDAIALSERIALACLVAAQSSLLTGVLVTVFPVITRHMA